MAFSAESAFALDSLSQTSSSGKPLDPVIFQRLNPRVYLEKFFVENIRPDGREFGEWRNVNVNVGSITSADGSALVRMGNTTVVCGVKAEIAEPELDKPSLGYIVPNIDLPPLCSPRFKSGPPGEEAQVLSERLTKALVSSSALPLSSLCIQDGKAVWVLYIDAICLNYDGNIFDAALLAVVLALKNTLLPKAVYSEETGQTNCTQKEKVPLQLQNLPLSASFGIFDATHLLADPTSFEEPSLETNITIILDSSFSLNHVSQTGLAHVGEKSSEEVIATCVAAAERRCTVLRKFVFG